MKKQPYHQPLLTRHQVPRALAAKAASECALMLLCADAPAQDVQLTLTKEGTNFILSWPASATNAVLESSTNLAAGWTAVTASPVTNNQTVKVIVPLVGPQQFFRLKTSEKDPVTDMAVSVLNFYTPPHDNAKEFIAWVMSGGGATCLGHRQLGT